MKLWIFTFHIKRLSRQDREEKDRFEGFQHQWQCKRIQQTAGSFGQYSATENPPDNDFFSQFWDEKHLAKERWMKQLCLNVTCNPPNQALQMIVCLCDMTLTKLV